MATYQELKSAAHIDEILALVEGMLGLSFRPYGKNKYSERCPFHQEKEDSFRVYVNDRNNEVRFHCFGKCKGDWDVYDLIMKGRNCSFREAQQILAQHIGDEYFKAYRKFHPPETEEPEPPVSISKPASLDQEIVAALEHAAAFYHKNLISTPDKYSAVLKYLLKRCVSPESVERFSIGYAPPFKDEEVEGRGLILDSLDSFESDYLLFHNYAKAGLFRHLDVEESPYRRYVDPREEWGIYGGYADYFAGRMTFPVRDERGLIHGIIGRRIDNRGRVRWLKQQTGNTLISPRGWLYGIDLAARHIARHKTVIIVEGIFDYFGFYNILQSAESPFIVSTLGTTLTDETGGILKSLGVENYIVAYDCDPAGKSAIENVARNADNKCAVYFLGEMEEGSDPADHLGKVAHAISGFSVKHLMESARKNQAKTDKPIYISHITTGSRKNRELLFKPAGSIDRTPDVVAEPPPFHYYNRDAFLPCLRYNHGNRANLSASLDAIVKLLNNPPQPKDLSDKTFRIKSDFISKEVYDDLGSALILWLWISIEQQRIKRFVRKTDSILAGRLGTSRKTVSKYKGELKELGVLNIDTTKKIQRLSVSLPGSCAD